MRAQPAGNRSVSASALRICLLSYRGNPRSGGQGIYVRLLSRALVELGHAVDVWSGPPYPELLPGVDLVRVPSLDLWNDRALLRRPSLRELRDPINLSEYTRTVLGGFPEPLTFTRRVARRFARERMRPRYDIVHDNQSLGPGLLALRSQVPVVATIHHPVTVDRRIALAEERDWVKRLGLRRWYSFLRTQRAVSRRLDRVLTVSESSARDLEREYGIDSTRLRVVGNGIDVDVFRPMPGIVRRENLLVTTLSADTPLKGFVYLLEAMARLREIHPALELRVVGQLRERSPRARALERLGLAGAVSFTGRVTADAIARLYAEATVAVVPSLYEGFGFPAGEAMACGVPVVATCAGALPEVVGRGDKTGVLVPPADARALADAIAGLLASSERRRAIGMAGYARILSQFTWRRAAERTVDSYRESIAERARLAC